MKLETCVYSGYKIHPGHGKRVVKTDGKVYFLIFFFYKINNLGSNFFKQKVSKICKTKTQSS